MGRPDFGVIQLMVQYNSDGNPTSVKYWDQEGCGHESGLISVKDQIQVLTNYHLRHAKQSHDMTLPRKCSHTQLVRVEGADSVTICCTREYHGPEKKHAFEW